MPVLRKPRKSTQKIIPESNSTNSMPPSTPPSEVRSGWLTRSSPTTPNIRSFAARSAAASCCMLTSSCPITCTSCSTRMFRSPRFPVLSREFLLVISTPDWAVLESRFGRTNLSITGLGIPRNSSAFATTSNGIPLPLIWSMSLQNGNGQALAIRTLSALLLRLTRKQFTSVQIRYRLQVAPSFPLCLCGNPILSNRLNPQLRKRRPVHPPVQRQQSVSAHQRVCANQEIRKNTSRPVRPLFPSALGVLLIRIPCLAANLFLQLPLNPDSRFFAKSIEKLLAPARHSQKLGVNQPVYDQLSSFGSFF